MNGPTATDRAAVPRRCERPGLAAGKATSPQRAANGRACPYVVIDSEGGDIFDANAIYNELSRHPATVTVDIDGMALSAASVIAMAGNRIRMAKNAVLMVHNPWTIHAGDAVAFRDTADILDKVKTTLVGAYRK